ncbi:MAG: SMC-Scp complex subunit ScpB [Desulfomonile tiedjei]|nr:SMC-Scp complex subunit ScpB [Desulfomonile tiedjei]
MEKQLLKSIVEGLIFAYHEPVSLDTLSRVIQTAGPESIKSVLDELEEEYTVRNRGFLLVTVAGGYQFRSLPAVAPWILEMKSMKPSKLSRAAMETLSIVAYNQPITRHQIEQVRGVESAATIRGLVERELIAIVGKKDIPGRPLLYGTTRRFLEVFGLSDLASLPPLPELETIAENME